MKKCKKLGFLHLVVQAVAPQILLGFLGGNTAEQQQGNEVGNGHQGIHAVGNIPDDVEIDDAAKEECHDIQNAVKAIRTATLNIVDGTLTIIAPTQDGAEGKRQDAKGEQGGSDVGNLRKSRLGKCGTIGIGDVWAAAATMGAEPIPLSLENKPRAIP